MLYFSYNRKEVGLVLLISFEYPPGPFFGLLLVFSPLFEYVGPFATHVGHGIVKIVLQMQTTILQITKLCITPTPSLKRE